MLSFGTMRWCCPTLNASLRMLSEPGALPGLRNLTINLMSVSESIWPQGRDNYLCPICNHRGL